MAKRFMYVCLGCLALAILFEISATHARAQSGSFRVIDAGVVVVGNSAYHLRTTTPPLGWTLMPEGNFDLPPVPPSTLLSYSSGIVAVTESGEGWGKVGGVWTNLGPVPGTAVQEATWGQVKAKYRH